MKFKILLFAVCVFYSFYGYAQNETESKKIEALLDNSFKIICYKENKICKTGSGFILFNNKKYYCITNEHVLEASDSAAIVFQNGERYKIEYIIATNQKLDVCIFSIDKINSNRTGLINPMTFNYIFNSISNIGDDVITISSPKGLINTYTKGVISAFRKIDDKNLFQISAPVSHGSSGGLLADAKYNPIGLIVSGYDEGQNLNFCLTLKQIFSVFLDQKIIDKNLTFNESNKVSVDNLELLIRNTDLEIKFISDLKKENKITEYNKAILEYNNNFLTFDMLCDKNELLILNKDLNSSLKLLLSIYNKYGQDVKGEFFRFLSIIYYGGGPDVERLSIKLLNEIEIENSEDTLINYFISTAKGFRYSKSNDYNNSLRYLQKVYDIGETANKDGVKALLNYFDGSEYSPQITIGVLHKFLQKNILLGLSLNYYRKNDIEKSLKYSSEYLLPKFKSLENAYESLSDLDISDIEVAIGFYGYGCVQTNKSNEFRDFCRSNREILMKIKLNDKSTELINYFLK